MAEDALRACDLNAIRVNEQANDRDLDLSPGSRRLPLSGKGNSRLMPKLARGD